MLFAEKPRCQLHSRLSSPGLRQRLAEIAASLRRQVRLRTRLRELLRGKRAEPARLGAPSRFSAGTWVRVIDAPRVFATLDQNKQRKGLVWLWQQWPYCGTVHRVFKPVRRMMDDAYGVRPVSHTVLLDTVPCGGPQGQFGCGRECPIMFRDEWLEEAPAPAEPPRVLREPELHATVRSAEEIRRTLDAQSTRGGLMFMPEMYAHAGTSRPVVRKVDRVLEGNRYVPAAQPMYFLEGLHCSGAILGRDGPCDRGCRLLWHEDWLRLERRPASFAQGQQPQGQGPNAEGA